MGNGASADGASRGRSIPYASSSDPDLDPPENSKAEARREFEPGGEPERRRSQLQLPLIGGGSASPEPGRRLRKQGQRAASLAAAQSPEAAAERQRQLDAYRRRMTAPAPAVSPPHASDDELEADSPPEAAGVRPPPPAAGPAWEGTPPSSLRVRRKGEVSGRRRRARASVQIAAAAPPSPAPAPEPPPAGSGGPAPRDTARAWAAPWGPPSPLELVSASPTHRTPAGGPEPLAHSPALAGGLSRSLRGPLPWGTVPVLDPLPLPLPLPDPLPAPLSLASRSSSPFGRPSLLLLQAGPPPPLPLPPPPPLPPLPLGAPEPLLPGAEPPLPLPLGAGLRTPALDLGLLQRLNLSPGAGLGSTLPAPLVRPVPQQSARPMIASSSSPSLQRLALSQGKFRPLQAPSLASLPRIPSPGELARGASLRRLAHIPPSASGPLCPPPDSVRLGMY